MTRYKSRNRTAKSFRRRTGAREPRRVVLIICEGKKTEPYYFQGLKEKLRLRSAHIEVAPSTFGPSPNKILKYAIYRLEHDGLDYDKVFCVFDRDRHSTYKTTLKKISHPSKGKQKIEAITSNPCFEIWLLLHFKYTTKPFGSRNSQSACNQVVRELKKHLPSYCKGLKTIFDYTKEKLNEAITNAERLQKHNQEIGSSNPSTDIFNLVKYLRNLE